MEIMDQPIREPARIVPQVKLISIQEQKNNNNQSRK
jgi:hypothetical protein